MIKKEFHYPSADGKTSIHGIRWIPEGKPRAVLQLAHGVAEYIDRYDPFARWLCEQGFVVTGNDHIGHGTSVAPGAAKLYFGPKGSWETVVQDIHGLYGITRQKFPGLPYFLLGHSMGSFLVRTYLIRYPGTVDGAILMGTGHMTRPMVSAGLALAAVYGRRTGWDKPNDIVNRLSFGSYNAIFAPNRTAYDWLSAYEPNVDAYIADPLCGGNASIGLFREMLRGIRFLTDPKNIRKMNRNTPILFVSGEMDPVGECGKGVRRAFDAFQKAGMRSVELKLYPGLRHEILNEAPEDRQKVYDDIAAWLEAHTPAREKAGAKS